MRMILLTAAVFALFMATRPLPASRAAELFEVTLQNPSFADGLDVRGTPRGWTRYGAAKRRDLKIVDRGDGGRALLIVDDDAMGESGITQTFALKGGPTYQAAVKVRAVEGATTAGAYLQFRFLPSNQFVQKGLTAVSTRSFSEISVMATAPPGTTQGVIYLYTHREPTPRVVVADVRVTGGYPPPPPPPPPPIPPQYEKLKELYLTIPLVQAGKPNAAIVVPASGIYQTAAATIQREIERRSGVRLPIVPAGSAAAAVPITGNLIVLGNRSTNTTIRALYDLYYCLVDLKYPGCEGYAVRSVHNPFGNGRSVVIVGGSDDVGVAEGAKALAAVLGRAPAARGELSIGWTMETKLGRGLQPRADLGAFQTWDASEGYRSVGYFGWCSISKRMAMYYMTGDEHSAREVVRLAFPDQQAIKDIERVDGEQIENKHDPLAGFYHYNAHQAILLWDLIEESPLFTNDERLRITNAFARQLDHRKGEGVYGLTETPRLVSSRHGQWSAISLYCLGRYFQKYYPDPVWAQCTKAGQLAFHSLHEHAWVAGESDNLFWYNTGMAPILTYMVLTGDRQPLENGVLAALLRGQEILVSGRTPDWALRSAAISFLNQAAYLTGDGRWITYRQRAGMDTNVFRLGQSFWPEETLRPAPPVDLVNRWSILHLPMPAWEARSSGLPSEQSFLVGSYRSAADAAGDYILLDGYNGASRNPYHTFDILELRLAGRTILQGYYNQVLTSADGMVEPAVAMDAALLHSDVVGATAIAVGEVPRAAFCNWQRTLAQRTGRYALIVDDLTFRSDSQNMKVTTTWQAPGGVWDRKAGAVRVPGAGPQPRGDMELRSCDVQQTAGSGVVSMAWSGAVKKDEHRIAFYLVAPAGPKASDTPLCCRVADNAVAIALPQPAVASVGEYGNIQGKLVVLATDHLFGHAVTSVGVSGPPMFASDAFVDVDWDYASGVVNVVAPKPVTLRLNLNETDTLRVDGATAPARRQGDVFRVPLSAGRHQLSGALPAAAAQSRLASALEGLQTAGKRRRDQALAVAASPPKLLAAELPVALTARVGGPVVDMIKIPSRDGSLLAVAEGNTIHVLTREGREIRTLQTDGKIRALRYWHEHDLLLAGCADEKVIAFDDAGRRRWVFTSQMDPAVYEAAKNYWFKSAPGHEGIHGLSTGLFDEGHSRCFVGSACTLEILDENGKLVKRMPVFWGPAWKFLLVPGPGGSHNLLVSQWPNGSDELTIVNSKAMAVTGRGYVAVPAGHSFVGGWTAQNRTALVYEDLAGDGRREVATAVNGTWNRVTVYTADGRPLANAQFGAGSSNAPRAQMRDMDVADLYGDGRKELVVGISEGLVVALDGQCRRLWSTRLPSPPVTLQCVSPRGGKCPWIVVGCEDGGVAVLDGHGVVIRRGKVAGRPTHTATLETAAGPLAVLATNRGEIKGFQIGG